MNAVLLVDFGSTYTKLTAVSLEKEEIISSTKSLSTVDVDITLGYNNAFRLMEEELRRDSIVINEKLACSSAAGGLKMIAIGLVPELTVEAAKRAALGAGARIIGTYSYELVTHEVKEIKESQPDIILLAGGTDGGNKDCIVHNARLIAKHCPSVPVIVAGNRKARDEIENIFLDRGVCYRISENVMPEMNVINVEPVRESIKKMFIERIVEAKGIKKAEKHFGSVIMPTPAAVLKAARILADGCKGEKGLGELVVVDIGGATTDVHSIAGGEPVKPGVTRRGLPEAYAKRSVEGDIGMRVSAQSLWEAAGDRIKRYVCLESTEIEKRCKLLANNPSLIPQTDEERDFDDAMGAVATEIAIERHVGFLEKIYTPSGIVLSQTGKDLQNIKYLIGTGGVLVNSANPLKILRAGLADKQKSQYLKPVSPEIMLDKSYIMSAMGLLAEKYPDKAVRILKKYLKKVGE